MLIITYYWPPSGGSGVQRWLKFVKYFRDFGIEPIVLTVNPEQAVYPIMDETLVNEIPEGVRVIYTDAKSPLDFYKKVRKKNVPHTGFTNEEKTGLMDKIMRFIRGNFFIPDARIGWNKFAFAAAEKIIQEEQIDSIVTTSPPHSTQLIGLALKEKFNVNWLADLRDPWTEIYYNQLLYRTPFAKKKDKRLESKWLNHPDAVGVDSEDIKRMFANGDNALEIKIHVIPNGFDEADFDKIETPKNEQQKVIRYIGNLGEQYPTEGLLIVFSNLIASDNSWKMSFIGNAPQRIKQQVIERNLESHIDFMSYVAHSKAIEYMKSATVLLLIIPQTANNKGILTGKLFEYIATGNPILCIGPEDGDAAKILNDFENCRCFSPENIALAFDWLKNSTFDTIETSEKRQQYSRKNLTKRISELVR